MLLGDPDSRVVAERGEDEGAGDAVTAKIRNALALYRPLRGVPGVEFRFHRTVLYNSVYLADDQLLVNTHVHGAAAAQAPVWHLHKLAGGELASLYIDSFERVWESATPAKGSQGAWLVASTSMTTLTHPRRTAWCRRSTWLFPMTTARSCLSGVRTIRTGRCLGGD